MAEQQVYASDEEKDVQAAQQKASSRPKMRGPVYKYSDYILEARAGGSEDKRGLISILSTMVITLIILGSVATAHYATELISSIANVDSTIDGHALFLATFFLPLTSCYTAAYLKYGLKITRLEMFTSRHLLVRFNRLTGQVHLPPFILRWSGDPTMARNYIIGGTRRQRRSSHAFSLLVIPNY